ncbi:MAG: heme-copper oxidase subunit III [Actinomycetota bacterium]
MSTAELAGDERAVRGTSSPVLGMVLFVASEAMFFAAFFAIYAMSYSSQPAWPPKDITVPGMGMPSVMTGLMVASSLFLQLGVRAIRKGDERRLSLWLATTLVLGAAFVALQLYGYSQVEFGIRSGIYASLFYIMSGVALAHVAGGVAFLGLVLVRSATGRLTMVRQEPAEAAAIYWHFVVVVSVAIYVAFYLLPSVFPKGP